MNGTTPTGDHFEKRAFTPIEIKDIIGACVQAGVREFKYGDLFFQFGGPTKIEIAAEAAPTEMAISAEKHDQMNEDSLAAEEFRAKQNRLAMLAIEDPAEFERQIADGELLDDDDSGGAEDRE